MENLSAVTTYGEGEIVEKTEPGLAEEPTPEPELKFFLTKRNCRKLMYEGHMYLANAKAPEKGITYWKCAQRTCNARVVLQWDAFKSASGVHVHDDCRVRDVARH